MPNTPFADELPKIPMTLLKRAKGFGEHGAVVVLESAGLNIAVTFMDPTSALIVWKDEGNLRSQIVQLTSISLPFGERPAFECPITSRACFDLCLYKERWASTVGHRLPVAIRSSNRLGRRQAKLEDVKNRLLGLEGTPKARGSNRRALVAAARKIPLALKMAPELYPIVKAVDDEESLETARAHRSRRQDGPFSTEAAIRRGASLGIHESDAQARTLLRLIPMRPVEQLDHTVLRQRPLRRLEGAATLNARVMGRLWDKTGAWMSVLAWPASAMEGFKHWELATDFSDPAGQLLIRGAGLQRSSVQVIQTLPAGAYKPNNRVFVCPVLGTRHDVLYLRDGLFASAKAQRLIHASQRA